MDIIMLYEDVVQFCFERISRIEGLLQNGIKLWIEQRGSDPLVFRKADLKDFLLVSMNC
jgi:hypothetical protein